VSLMLRKGLLAAACCVANLLHSPANAQTEALGMQWGRDALSTCGQVDNQQGRRDTTAALICLGWVNGAVQAASDTVSTNAEKPSYCTPRVGGSTGQYVAVFLQFLRNNPAKQHLPAIYLFHQAMAEAFPCR
jgi:hypothetical protein